MIYDTLYILLLLTLQGAKTPLLLNPPWQQPRLILFVEALVVKGAFVLKRDSLEMRWRMPLGA